MDEFEKAFHKWLADRIGVPTYFECARWAEDWFQKLYSDTGRHELEEKTPKEWREAAIFWEERQREFWKKEENLQAENSRLRDALEYASKGCRKGYSSLDCTCVQDIAKQALQNEEKK